MSTEPIALPPLPESHRKGITGRSFFDSDQMRAYALSAVAALQAQVEALSSASKELRGAMQAHNADCESQCLARKNVCKTSCYMLGYERDCGDCPKDGMIEIPAALASAAQEG